MLLTIRHETFYRYSAPQSHTIQQLRLWPRSDPHQHTQAWHITAPGHRHAFTDAFGNLGHMLTVDTRHDELRIVAEGSVRIDAPDRGRLAGDEALSPLVFTVPTRLTAADDAVREFAGRLQGTGSAGLLALADAIRGSVAYETGATAVTTTASDALVLGRGVCQDHAHLFIACCHARGIPARYVSGYIDPGGSGHADSHAWVDAWVDDGDFAGWVSIDVTHVRLAGDGHCRLAVGRDYESAAPVRGVRRGGGSESLDVRVSVTPQGADQ